MNALHFILNLAALLLWLNWRSIRFVSVPAPAGISIVGTLKRAEAPTTKRWASLVTLLLVLFIRSLFYHQIGSLMTWTPVLELGAVALPFRSDRLGRILAFSFLDFGVWLGGLYAWMLLLSVVNRRVPDTDPFQRMIRLHLGRIERVPDGLKLALPAVMAALAWLGLQPLLARMGLTPADHSFGRLVGQALWLGLASVQWWVPLIIGILVLHIVNSYLYLGTFALWQFSTITAHHLLKPLQVVPWRIGRLDFSPFAGLGLVLLAGHGLSRWLPVVYQHL